MSRAVATTAAELVRDAIAASMARIVEHEPVVRADEDPEGVHQARVGCRRLRSDLRTFAPILDRTWSESLRDELRWLGAALGAVRDLDVLVGRLRAAAASLDPADRAAVEPALADLVAARRGHLGAAVEALDSARYRLLLDRLAAAGRDPRVLPEAGRPAAEVIPALAATAFARLRKAARRLGERPSDEELHALRIRAKQARYAVDAAAPVVGAGARRTADALARLQDVLGELHDCAAAEQRLRAIAEVTPDPRAAFGLGWLAADQHREAERLRSSWREAWRSVDRPKRTRWMRS